MYVCLLSAAASLKGWPKSHGSFELAGGAHERNPDHSFVKTFTLTVQSLSALPTPWITGIEILS